MQIKISTTCWSDEREVQRSTHGAENNVTSCRLAKNSYPSSTTWWARQIKSMSCFCKKRVTTSGPNVNDTPRSFSDQPVMSLSGSDHNRSQRRPGVCKLCQLSVYSGELQSRLTSSPVSGTSVGRITRRICSIDCRSGDRPPCMVKIFSSMIAAIGRQLKQSVNVFHNLMLYLRLPVQCEAKLVSIPVLGPISKRGGC